MVARTTSTRGCVAKNKRRLICYGRREIHEGCTLYLTAQERAKQGERTISMDELTGVQALERLHPDLPMIAGHVLRREFEYIQHGTLSWFFNFDVVTGQVIEPSWGPTRSDHGPSVQMDLPRSYCRWVISTLFLPRRTRTRKPGYDKNGPGEPDEAQLNYLKICAFVY